MGDRIADLVEMLEEHPVWGPGNGWYGKDGLPRYHWYQWIGLALDDELSEINRSDPWTVAHWNMVRTAIAEVESNDIFGAADRCCVCGGDRSFDGHTHLFACKGVSGYVLAVCRTCGVCVVRQGELPTRVELVRAVLHARKLHREAAKPTGGMVVDSRVKSLIGELDAFQYPSVMYPSDAKGLYADPPKDADGERTRTWEGTYVGENPDGETCPHCGGKALLYYADSWGPNGVAHGPVMCGRCCEAFDAWGKEQDAAVKVTVRPADSPRRVRPLHERGRQLCSGDLHGPTLDPRGKR